jgi:hypothetical protein
VLSVDTNDLNAVVLSAAEAALAPAMVSQIGTAHTAIPHFGHLQISGYPVNQSHRVIRRKRRHAQMVEYKVIAPDVLTGQDREPARDSVSWQ